MLKVAEIGCYAYVCYTDVKKTWANLSFIKCSMCYCVLLSLSELSADVHFFVFVLVYAVGCYLSVYNVIVFNSS